MKKSENKIIISVSRDDYPSEDDGKEESLKYYIESFNPYKWSYLLIDILVIILFIITLLVEIKYYLAIVIAYLFLRLGEIILWQRKKKKLKNKNLNQQ